MEEDTHKNIYRVISVEQTAAPDDQKGIWHRYVVQRGNSIIEGVQLGAMPAVREHAESYANTLNERFVKGNHTYRTPRKK